MNAAEHIVEAYFRHCRGCFTYSDRKVANGNNRQLDVLAYDIKTKSQFHIEVAVTHRTEWCCTSSELRTEFEKKFFGMPPERENRTRGTTDFEKGKQYFSQIEETYIEAGFSPAEVKRVWVCWIVSGEENGSPLNLPVHMEQMGRTFEIEVLSLRDFILPKLEERIGTAHYDDEILRTLGLLKQREEQTRGTK